MGIEKERAGVNARAEGLARRVEGMLARKEQAEALAEAAPQRALAKRMTVLATQFDVGTGVSAMGGFFEVTTGGKVQRYEELEAGQAQGVEEVWRLLELANLADLLRWPEKEKSHRAAAVEAARKLAAREPQEPGAQVALAMALDWGIEKRQVIEAVLERDAGEPLARQMLLVRQVDKALESAVLRKEVPLEDEETEVIRGLYDRPLSEAERQTLKSSLEALWQHAELVLQEARQRGDMRAYLRTLTLLQAMDAKTQMVETAAKGDPDEGFLLFQARCSLLTTVTVMSMIKARHVRDLLAMAGDDPEMVGRILFLALTSGMMDTAARMTAGREASELPLELIGKHFARLVEMAGAGGDERAARAAEAVAAVEWVMYVALRREPYYWEMLPRAIRLAPCLYRNLVLLTAWNASQRDFAALGALTEMRIALAPNSQAHRERAASCVRLGDFAAAHRHLDDCLKEAPEDVMLLNQKAVTWLREDPAGEGLAKAAAIYDPILSRLHPHLLDLEEAEREVLACNVALFLVLSGKDDEAEALLKNVSAAKLLSEEKIKLIREQLRVPTSI